MSNISRKTLRTVMAGSALLGSLALAGTALAAEPVMGRGSPARPAVVGTVASVSGTTLTVTAQARGRDAVTSATPTTYTVNAGSATITKDGVTSSVSAIAIGDHVMVQGTASGTTVAATAIHDGILARSDDERGPLHTLSNITGNGEPVIGGNVTAINGGTLTVTTKAGTAYTVDVVHANVNKANATSTVSAIAVGDSVVIQGAINGTSVVASSVVDHGTLPSASGSTAATPARSGFFGAIGGFFTRLFGFF